MSAPPDPYAFGKFVPGFDFLQSLVQGASRNIPPLPSLVSWIAPTLNVEELEKRIGELKAAQFWLEQNTTALKATIQALEVQKMTLATLKGMNLSMGEMADALKFKPAGADSTRKSGTPAADAAPSVNDSAAAPPRPRTTHTHAEAKPAEATSVPGPAAADPLQWWGALTRQFQQIATDAMRDAARQTAPDNLDNPAAGSVRPARRNTGATASSPTDRTAPARPVRAGTTLPRKKR